MMWVGLLTGEWGISWLLDEEVPTPQIWEERGRRGCGHGSYQMISISLLSTLARVGIEME